MPAFKDVERSARVAEAAKCGERMRLLSVFDRRLAEISQRIASGNAGEHYKLAFFELKSLREDMNDA